MSRKRYYAARILQTVFLLWLVATILFFLFRSMPGSYTDLMLFQGASAEQVAAFRERWGLDDPLYVQYLRFIGNLATLDAGTSLEFQEPVWEVVKTRLFNSIILVAPGITLGYILGSIYGTILGTRRGSKLEKHGLAPLIGLSSVPAFYMAIIAIMIFANWLGLFPSFGMIPAGVYEQYQDASWLRPYLTQDFLYHYILPLSVVTFRYLYLPALIMRTSVVETVGQEFTFYQRMSGLPRLNRMRHIAHHSILPVVTMYPISLTRAISGLVLIETVFNWPGIGYTLVTAIFERDFPVIQFVFFLVAASIIVSNFLVDIFYGIVDPRVSLGE